MIITVDNDTFRKWFPYFKDAADESIQASYEGAGSLIALETGVICLSAKSQTRGVYLATAHLLYLSMNPDKAASANLSSASEGSVSASFQLYSDPWRRYFSLSPYGTELLALLSTVQPPLPEKPINVLPYYNSVGFR